MQYLLSVAIDESEMANVTEEEMQRAFKQVDEFNKDLEAAGKWVLAGGLHPTSAATTLRYNDGNITTTDGPFAESKEVLGGFWVIKADDLDEALKWAEKGARACEGTVEVRPFQGEDDVESVSGQE